MATIGRNDPCPCGSGKKYKKCCLQKQQSFSVSTDRPIEFSRPWQSTDGGRTWQEIPNAGPIPFIISGSSPENIEQAIEDLFLGAISLTDQKRSFEVRTKLHDCKHKLYAVVYHLKTIEREIDREVEEMKQPKIIGGGFESENPTLIYETEAFLFQVKSSLDMIIKALRIIIPELKLDSFRSASKPFMAGGRVISKLQELNEPNLAQLFETHRLAWIQEMTIWRDTITHESALKDFRCFVQPPFYGGQLEVRYPTMPSGERVDTYCLRVYDALCQLYRDVLKNVEDRIEQT